MEGYPTWQELTRIRIKVRDGLTEYWLSNNLFSFQWWLQILVTILFVLTWWKLVDRKRMMEILLYGCIIALISSFLDVTGVSFVLWGYPNMVLPLVPPMIFINFIILPIPYMLSYQKFNQWKSFFFAAAIISAVFSFVFEPLLVWLDIYSINNWKYIYSFPIYLIMALSVKWITEKVKNSSKI